LLIQVHDASDPRYREYAEQVEQVLEEINAHTIPRLHVYNKIDRLEQDPRLERDRDGLPQSVWLSATTGAGIDLLLQAIGECAHSDTVHTHVRLPPEAGRQRARLFNLGAVIDEHLTAQGEWLIEVQTSRKNLKQLCRHDGFREEWMDCIV
jgi:GTP-binding protein HflX